jgi:DNA-binding NtrC family response regulator
MTSGPVTGIPGRPATPQQTIKESQRMSEQPLLCIVEEPQAHEALFLALRRAGWTLRVAGSPGAAARTSGARTFSVGMLLPQASSDPAAWEAFLRQHAGTQWVGLFAEGLLESAAWRDLVLNHLFDHHTLPLDSPRLLVSLGHALGRARLAPPAESPQDAAGELGMIGRSPAMLTLVRQIRRVAPASAPVLIGGESGSGKELAALAIQRLSSRARAPFLSVNCGAIPAALVQSELFGHVRGAFTGADRDKAGIFEAANHGTVFLDEIGDLSMDVQVSLLRFLQDRVVMRVGSTTPHQLDVRVIAATHVDLERAIEAGRFRLDLYYRLKVLGLSVPPLRERRGDIELLARHFFVQFAGEADARLKGFSHGALRALVAHPWPGNVRELANRVRGAVVMSEGRYITPCDLGLADPEDDTAGLGGLQDARIEAERHAISHSLDLSCRNVTQAARRLGVSRMTLYRLMAKHGIRAQASA